MTSTSPDPAGVPLLRAVGLDYTYPAGPVALRGVNLDIATGRRRALLGANGSGKSTLLLALNASILADAGCIEFQGEAIGTSRRERNLHRRRVGLVLQDPDDQLFSASVFEDVSFGPLNLGLDDASARQRVEEVLDQLALTDLADRPAHLLSFGQRKRVAIAGVAAMRPDVMALDEPFAGLDPMARREVVDTLARLEASGTTIVLTTHDLELAYAWADDVTLLNDGEVLADGSPDAVLGDRTVCERARLDPPPIIGLLEAAVGAGWLTAAQASEVRTVDQLRQVIETRSSGGSGSNMEPDSGGALRDALHER